MFKHYKLLKFVLILVIIITLISRLLLSYQYNLEGFDTENKVIDEDKKEEERIKNLTKKECELVIARYNEDISWSKPYAHLRTVYNKGKEDLDAEYEPIVKLPNVGTEIHTILEHIIRNYDNLSNNTVFFQGKIADRVCQDTIPLYKFFHSRDDDLVGCKSKINESYDWHHPEFYLERKVEPCDYNIGDFFKNVLNIEYKPNMDAIYQSQIAVGKKRILKHPKQYYIDILYNKTNIAKATFPEEGHFMERAWVAIFS